ncbi:nitric-oxide reductase large subunit [Aureispira anguillae]|uniref:Nitric-oxide reductase large subunit n=1 Tax=Aureispira anguillae TaxID=2864201 RepID=A0A916DPV2_9BACT|nr:nitric-oxide reductase large subunit [Aureispira anguillae]BDS10779.1 nitric-oxide reductase large subunit [Aureispira anguillae]
MRKIWALFAMVIVLSFAILSWVGTEIYQQQPPIPNQVLVEPTGTIIYSGKDIQRGQNVWESIGGMEVGSIWGHGSYVAPDWTADWIHREAEFMLDAWARELGATTYQALNEEQQAQLKARLIKEIRTNTFKESNGGTITLSAARYAAIQANVVYYSSIFRDGRDEYAIPKNSLTDSANLADLNAFLFWTSWAASTNRPDQSITYTSNWPHEPLIDNTISTDAQLWSGFSIILLLLFIGLLVLYQLKKKHENLDIPNTDPLVGLQLVASQKAVLKYFFVISLLIALQVLLGALTVHYTVEGTSFFGVDLIAEFFPYSVTRTWHTQLAIFWIAATWLATGLFFAPIISGQEMKFQIFGINFLFGALLLIVLGSMFGEWLGIHQFLDLTTNFFFGHQGYEYMDLGRFWQYILAIGLILWMFMVGRHIVYGIKQNNEAKHLLILFLIAVIAIGMFFFSGLMYGENSSLPVINYWRWWLVHLWVEGFFEVFATVAIAFIFTKMGVISSKTAGRASVISAIIFLAGGIVGTLHHLYFSGTPVHAIALGATFSALEVVPLTLVGFEIWENWELLKSKPWMERYKWPIYFFIAVSFWNMIGAGVFGFLINPPIALYYIQGLNTTPVHAHTALFGVYGMLGMGFIVTCLRLCSSRKWEALENKKLKRAFWMLNIGLLAMVLISLLPVGIIQAQASIEHGYWYARSSELLYSPLVQTLKWLRMIGDVLFSIGIFYFCWFCISETFYCYKKQQ